MQVRTLDEFINDAPLQSKYEPRKEVLYVRLSTTELRNIKKSYDNYPKCRSMAEFLRMIIERGLASL